MTTPSSSQLKCQVYLAFGTTLGQEDKQFSFTEASTVTGNIEARIPLKYSGGASDQSLNLANYCATATYIAIVDLGGTGIKVGNQSGAGKDYIAPNGLKLIKNGAATPPTLYFDNPDGSNAAYIQVIVLGAQT